MKMISVVLCSLFFASAYAAEQSNNGSEEMHQAPASTFELEPQLALRDNVQNYTSGAKIEQTGALIGVKAEYGFNDTLSAGLLLGYASLSGKISGGSISVSGADSKGLNDPSLFLNARFNAGPGSIRFGTSLSFSLEKSKIDSNLNSNPATGGTALDPFVGYEMYFDKNTFGARVAYGFLLSNQKRTDSQSGVDVDETISGVNSLHTSLFYERAIDNVTLGFAFDLINNSKTTIKVDSTGSSSDGSPTTYWDLDVYVPIRLTSNLTLLPETIYQTGSALPSTISSFNSLTIQCGARFAF
jgi:hypothetical protein